MIVKNVIINFFKQRLIMSIYLNGKRTAGSIFGSFSFSSLAFAPNPNHPLREE